MNVVPHIRVLSLRRDSPPKSSPILSIRPRSSVSRVMVDLIRRSWVRFPRRSRDFFFTSCGSLIPLYCTCILLHCREFTKHIWKGLLLSQDQNDKKKYGELDWTRSRIGSHDNFVKTKDTLSRFKDHFWSVMCYDVPFKCILLAHTKTSCWTIQNVEWCDVLVFTNNYLQATKTICANYSQGNQVIFGENAVKQCVTMSVTAAVINHHIEDINFWTSSTLNNIFTIANNLYMYISVVRWSVQTNDYLCSMHRFNFQ